MTSALATVALFTVGFDTPASLSNPDRAWIMFERLVGRPPSQAELSQFTAQLAAGQTDAAFDSLTRSSDFLNLTARNFCQPMSTRSELTDGTMNDFTASCMGIVRDDMPATDFLTGDYLYQFNLATDSYDPSVKDWFQRRQHYDSTEGLDALGFDYSKNLVKYGPQEQPQLPADRFSTAPITAVVPHPDPAGLLTSSTFVNEHADGGTNRRMVEYAFREFTCRAIADFADATASDAWIGRDVDRAPGGNPQVFQTTCRSCHSQLDSLRGAFGYLSWGFRGNVVNQSPVTATTQIQDKYSSNASVYPNGHVTTDTSWQNLATQGSNADYFGWRGATSGKGMAAFGQMLASSQAFSRCMVQRVVQTVCLRPVTFADQQGMVLPEAANLESDGYNLRHLFSRIARNPLCIDPTQAN